MKKKVEKESTDEDLVASTITDLKEIEGMLISYGSYSRLCIFVSFFFFFLFFLRCRERVGRKKKKQKKKNSKVTNLLQRVNMFFLSFVQYIMRTIMTPKL